MTRQQTIQSIAEAREIWKQISRQHITLGASCTCSIGLSIRIEDFDQDICDFLEADAKRSGRIDVLDTLNQMRPPGQNEPLTLLQLMDALERSGDPAALAFVTPRLAVTLDSIAKAHRGMSFRCD